MKCAAAYQQYDSDNNDRLALSGDKGRKRKEKKEREKKNKKIERKKSPNSVRVIRD